MTATERPGRNDQRSRQGRGDAQARSVKDQKGGGIGDVGMGRPGSIIYRLMGPLGYVLPAEFEANYHRQRASQVAIV